MVFLALSYFGTDQSQVGRYLTAKNSAESRLGLLINGLVKVPMQFFILLIGALLFAFYQFKPSPVFHNRAVDLKARETIYKDSLKAIQDKYVTTNARQSVLSAGYINAYHANNTAEINALKDSARVNNKQLDSLREEYKVYIKKLFR